MKRKAIFNLHTEVPEYVFDIVIDDAGTEYLDYRGVDPYGYPLQVTFPMEVIDEVRRQLKESR